MHTETTKKLFSVDDYYKMADVGILKARDHTELINGEIIQVSPMGSHHAAAVTRVNNLFVRLFQDKALLRPQLPLRLNRFNEPEPDIVLLKPHPDCYSSQHPGPVDVFLVMEISVSSLRYDRDIKLPIYASSRVPEIWIVDLQRESLLVYRDPGAGGYATALHLERGNAVSCLAFPETKLDVNDLFG
jgi:Uma2 family endonuclease